MSRDFAFSFFPATLTLLDRAVPDVVDYIFPQDVVTLCAEVHVHGTRNPVLGLAAIWGAYFGLRQAWLLHGNGRRHLLWSLAFANFAVMNVAALPLHCFLPAVRNTATMHPTYWALDTFATGASCWALVYAAVLAYQERNLWPNWRWSRLPKAQAPFVWALTCSIGIASWVWLTTHRELLHSWPLELWYLVSVTVAAVVVFPLAVLGGPLHGAGLLVLGANLTCGGIWLDATLCRLTENVLWDALTAPTLTFIGSNLTFHGVAIALEGLDPEGSTRTRKKQKRKAS